MQKVSRAGLSSANGQVGACKRLECVHNTDLLCTAGEIAVGDTRIDAIRRTSGKPVTLVGWSLGGLYAREYAKFAQSKVGGVVTMGTPFSGDPRANHAWRLYQLVSGFPVDTPPFPCTREEKPPVPTVALWSPRDGVILPECARGRAGERDRAIEVDCTHMGFAAAPEGILAVGKALEMMAA